MFYPEQIESDGVAGEIDRAVGWAVEIANDDPHGYSQSVRFRRPFLHTSAKPKCTANPWDIRAEYVRGIREGGRKTCMYILTFRAQCNKINENDQCELAVFAVMPLREACGLKLT